MDIWVQSIGGKKKGKVAGLGSLGRSVKALKHSTSTLPGEIDEMIKSQVHTSNANLYAQLQEERCKNKKMRKELDLLKKYVNFNASSSNELSSQEDNQESEDGSDNDSDNVNESGSNPGNVNETKTVMSLLRVEWRYGRLLSGAKNNGERKMTTSTEQQNRFVGTTVAAMATASSSRTTPTLAMASAEKPEKFSGVDFKCWK
ncbi:PREDICTED: uncharacterized protein LOC109208072 [Nicotiana attenuata]|uniref:uncharacterized protein LOC109208072 n=1 Tax=Nicotiana attenuata TaxID=49451 RepID=UPI0009056AE4|nr:PREDICTED: uncharacterized protein LOC109208072 [Nicotiana attenuata]